MTLITDIYKEQLQDRRAPVDKKLIDILTNRGFHPTFSKRLDGIYRKDKIKLVNYWGGSNDTIPPA